MATIKILLLTTTLIAFLIPMSSNCAAAEQNDQEENTKEAAHAQLTPREAHLILWEALQENNVELASYALSQGADPNKPLRNSTCDRLTHWLLDDEPDLLTLPPEYQEANIVTKKTFYTGIKYTIPLLAFTSYDRYALHLMPYKLGATVAAFCLIGVHNTYRTYLHYKHTRPDYARKRIQRKTLSLPPLSYTDNIEIIKLLLDHQANVDITDNNDNTALTNTIKKYNTLDKRAFGASQRTILQKIKILSLAGAHLNYFNDSGESPAIIADQEIKDMLIEMQKARQLLIAPLDVLQQLLEPGSFLEQILPERNIAYIIIGYSLPINFRRIDEDAHWVAEFFIKNSPELTKAQAWISESGSTNE